MTLTELITELTTIANEGKGDYNVCVDTATGAYDLNIIVSNACRIVTLEVVD